MELKFYISPVSILLLTKMGGKRGILVSFLVVLTTVNLINLLHALPVYDEYGNLTNETFESLNSTNGTNKDLIIIKTIVYEIGILTDSDDDSDNSTETREQVDLTFFNPPINGTTIDLSNIPLPIQTNVSGHSVTGIVPANLGTIKLPDGAENKNITFTSSVLPNAVVSVTHNVSTTNSQKTQDILNQISPIINLPQLSAINAIKENVNNTENEP